MCGGGGGGVVWCVKTVRSGAGAGGSWSVMSMSRLHTLSDCQHGFVLTQHSTLDTHQHSVQILPTLIF